MSSETSTTPTTKNSDHTTSSPENPKNPSSGDHKTGSSSGDHSETSSIHSNGHAEVNISTQDGVKNISILKSAPQQPIDDTVGADPDDMIDPVCDPRHPHGIHFSDISTAAFNIRDGIVRTPCTVSNSF